MKKATLAFYRHGDAPLFALFDVGQMGYVCDLVRDNEYTAPCAHGISLATTLREQILEPADSFIRRLYETGRGTSALQYQPAEAFCKALENVVAYWEEGNPDPRAAGGLANALRSSWVEFIAFGATCSMTEDLPRELKKRRIRSDKGADGTKDAADVRHKQLDPLIKACIARGDDPFAKIGKWAKEQKKKTSEATVRRRIKKIIRSEQK